VVLLSILVLGERVGLWRWGAVMIGFAGAMLILRPGTEAFQPAALLPIAASACYGLSMVTVRLFDKSVSNALLYLYSAMSSALGAIMLAAFTTEFHPVASLADAGLILLMSLIGGTAVLFLMLAYRLASPSMLAPFGYFGILTAFGFGYVVFGENPAQTLFPGVLLIVGAGIVILWRERPA
jgi:drug/metabolite transporter (DMT)-like permease